MYRVQYINYPVLLVFMNVILELCVCRSLSIKVSLFFVRNIGLIITELQAEKPKQSAKRCQNAS